jgi:hypothetical protein
MKLGLFELIKLVIAVLSLKSKIKKQNLDDAAIAKEIVNIAESFVPGVIDADEKAAIIELIDQIAQM